MASTVGQARRRISPGCCTRSQPRRPTSAGGEDLGVRRLRGLGGHGRAMVGRGGGFRQGHFVRGHFVRGLDPEGGWSYPFWRTGASFPASESLPLSVNGSHDERATRALEPLPRRTPLARLPAAVHRRGRPGRAAGRRDGHRVHRLRPHRRQPARGVAAADHGAGAPAAARPPAHRHRRGRHGHGGRPERQDRAAPAHDARDHRGEPEGHRGPARAVHRFRRARSGRSAHGPVATAAPRPAASC